MTTVDVTPQQFRLSMLLYDTRYRSLTIQAVALLLFMLAAAWLVNNTVQNLAALGKDFSFGFLGARAGYDISQTLIPYTNDSTHARAALVGIVNTLLVAVVGCLLATVIGVLMGVLRLSNNWIVARLAAVYVDGFRNIPVLLWILATMAIITDMAPAPAAFRGENATASMLFGSVAVTNRGVYLPWPVFGPGSQVVVGAFILSLIAIMIFGRYAARRQEATGEILPTFSIKLGLFLVPALLANLVMGGPITLDYPELQRFNFEGGGFIDKAFIALTLALALYTGAFIAEAVRAGIQAVSRGQSEAAGALGLRSNRVMSLVDPAAGAAGDHPAVDLAIPEPDQELVARHRGRLRRRARHARRHHHEPDRARARMHAAADGLLPGPQPADLGGDELVQRLRGAEGALRCRTSPTAAPPCCRPRSRRAPPSARSAGPGPTCSRAGSTPS